MSSSRMVLAMILLLGGSVGCASGRHSSAGFRLPDGDSERGQRAFLALECHRCHEVAGVVLPRTSSQPAPILLGGLATANITDGYLATSIIYPQHRVALGARDKLAARAIPPMPDYTERVTARDLQDLVTFLQAHYREPVRVPYAGYY